MIKWEQMEIILKIHQTYKIKSNQKETNHFDTSLVVSITYFWINALFKNTRKTDLSFLKFKLNIYIFQISQMLKKMVLRKGTTSNFLRRQRVIHCYWFINTAPY